MISLYSYENTNYEKNGDVALIPTEGKMKQVAGGSYSLTMKHPIDPYGKWAYLVPEAVLKIPVPSETIESTYSGVEIWIYRTNGVVSMRSGTTEPSTITYSTWNATTSYQKGSKVSYQGKNYKAIYYDDSSGQTQVPPPNNAWWKEISRETDGDPVVAQLSAGTELTWIEGGNSDTWWKMETGWGIQGYVKQSELTLVRHVTPEENGPVTINTQLFRIKKVTVDTSSMTVNVEADHVSYDQGGNLIKKAEISKASPAEAINKITANLMMELRGEIATNLKASECGTYTQTLEAKSAIYAILDPSVGLAATFDAAVKRDNWKIYLLKKDSTYRGKQFRFGKNMKGVNWVRKSDSLITRVVPVAKDSEGEELYLTNPFVDADNINNFPVVHMEKLSVDGQVGKDDGTDTDTTWTQTALFSEMQTKAEERFTVDKANLIAEEVTVDFEQLGDTAEHPELKDLETVLLYDLVEVIDDRIGLYTRLEVTELEWDFIRRKITALKLSNVKENVSGTVTGYQVQSGSLGMNKLTTSVRKAIIAETVDKVLEIYEE